MNVLDEWERRMQAGAKLGADAILLDFNDLDALIRVARAAEAFQRSVAAHLTRDLTECWDDLAVPERIITDALRQLRDLEAGE